MSDTLGETDTPQMRSMRYSAISDPYRELARCPHGTAGSCVDCRMGELGEEVRSLRRRTHIAILISAIFVLCLAPAAIRLEEAIVAAMRPTPPMTTSASLGAMAGQCMGYSGDGGTITLTPCSAEATGDGVTWVGPARVAPERCGASGAQVWSDPSTGRLMYCDANGPARPIGVAGDVGDSYTNGIVIHGPSQIGGTGNVQVNGSTGPMVIGTGNAIQIQNVGAP
jgi:hypothetical protein